MDKKTFILCRATGGGSTETWVFTLADGTTVTKKVSAETVTTTPPLMSAPPRMMAFRPSAGFENGDEPLGEGGEPLAETPEEQPETPEEQPEIPEEQPEIPEGETENGGNSVENGGNSLENGDSGEHSLNEANESEEVIDTSASEYDDRLNGESGLLEEEP